MMQSGLRNHLGGTKPEFLVSWVPGFQGSVVVTDAKVREATGAHPPIADSSLACGQPRRRLRGKSAGGPCPSVASAFPGHTPGAGSSTACARPPRHRLSLHYRRLLRKAKAHGQQVVKGTTTATAGEGGKGSQAMGRLTLISMFYR